MSVNGEMAWKKLLDQWPASHRDEGGPEGWKDWTWCEWDQGWCPWDTGVQDGAGSWGHGVEEVGVLDLEAGG